MLSPSSKLASLFALCTALGGCTAIGNFDYKFDLVEDSGRSDSGSADVDASEPGDDAAIMDAAQVDGTVCEASETACDDDVDNDCDGKKDCKDSDCAGALSCCKPTEIPERSCGDGIDNDCNGKLDCADMECITDTTFCCQNKMPEISNDSCGDKLDNDCDGVTDCAETSCAMRMACCVAMGAENTTDACADGLDDDCDGKTDCADPECAPVSTACCTRTAAGPEVACGDGVDNDCDGIVDCTDSDCRTALACAGCVPFPVGASSETSCNDNLDNDCDSFRDCRDSDCTRNLACCVASGAENSAASCVDQQDNDCDGKLDCADEQCAGVAACCVASPENSEAACRDNVDNDCDGITDCADPSCTGLGACCVSSGAEGTLCTDAKDNDCDGKVDCADSDCGNAPNCCVKTGAELNNTGIDEDCDGFADLPPPIDMGFGPTFPQRDGAAAGSDVTIKVTPSAVAGSTLECRSYRRGGMQGPFVSCALMLSAHKPFNAAQSAALANNGAWQTEFRTRFATGLTSPTSNFTYYVHNSMHGAVRCPTPTADTQWFSKAKERLAAYPAGSTVPQVFAPGVDTFLANPFIRLSYNPPFGGIFQVGGKAASSPLRSLRRRFALSGGADANRYLLVVRNYRSTHTQNCKVVDFRVHLTHHQYNWKWVSGQHEHADYACDAIVLNRAGAGVCLNGTAGAPVFGQNNNDPVTSSLGFNGAKQYMWHQLTEPDNFTDKCEGSTTCALHLPDRALFPAP